MNNELNNQNNNLDEIEVLGDIVSNQPTNSLNSFQEMPNTIYSNTEMNNQPNLPKKKSNKTILLGIGLVLMVGVVGIGIGFLLKDKGDIGSNNKGGFQFLESQNKKISIMSGSMGSMYHYELQDKEYNKYYTGKLLSNGSYNDFFGSSSYGYVNIDNKIFYQGKEVFSIDNYSKNNRIDGKNGVVYYFDDNGSNDWDLVAFQMESQKELWRVDVKYPFTLSLTENFVSSYRKSDGKKFDVDPRKSAREFDYYFSDNAVAVYEYVNDKEIYLDIYDVDFKRKNSYESNDYYNIVGITNTDYILLVEKNETNFVTNVYDLDFQLKNTFDGQAKNIKNSMNSDYFLFEVNSEVCIYYKDNTYELLNLNNSAINQVSFIRYPFLIQYGDPNYSIYSVKSKKLKTGVELGGQDYLNYSNIASSGDVSTSELNGDYFILKNSKTKKQYVYDTSFKEILSCSECEYFTASDEKIIEQNNEGVFLIDVETLKREKLDIKGNVREVSRYLLISYDENYYYVYRLQ